VAGPRLVESFTAWARGRPDLDPDVVPTMVDLKAEHLGDGHPGRWHAGDITELLLEIVPRTVLADEQWHAGVVATLRAFLTYAARRGLLHRESSGLEDLLGELREVESHFDEVVPDSERAALARAIMDEAGGDGRTPADSARLESLVARFKGLPSPDEVDDLDVEHDDSFDDEDEELGEDDAWEGPEQLPAVRLAPREALVAAARASGVLADLDRLVGRFAGGGDTRPPAAEPPRIDARSRRLVALAARLGLIRIDLDTGQLGPGPRTQMLQALHETGPEADELLLDLWVDAFIGLLDASLAAGAADGDPDGDDPVVDIVGEVVSHAVVSAYTGDPHSVDLLLDEMVRPQVKNGVLPADAEEGVARHVGEILDLLADLGAVDPVAAGERGDADIELTPLGVYGLREYALDEGVDAPVVGEIVSLPAAAAVRQIAASSERVAVDLAREWIEARERDEAVAELLGVARSGTAALREVVLSVLQDVLEDEFDSALTPIAKEPLLGPVVRGFVATRNAVLHELASLRGGLGQDATFEDFMQRLREDDAEALAALRSAAGPLGWRNAELLPGDDELLLVETFARVLDGMEPPIRRDDLDDDIWLAADDAAVPRMAAVPHPQLLFVLDAIGTGHPQGRVRKAAKKAAHKHRIAVGG
jgi:hypothetical protein